MTKKVIKKEDFHEEVLFFMGYFSISLYHVIQYNEINDYMKR